MSQPICIVGAKRTPQGRFMGALAKRSAADLGAAAAKAAMQHADVKPEQVDLTIVGNVLSAGLGQNVARQIAIAAGVPVERSAFAVNMMCASGMKAAMLAAQAIRSDEARVVLCGGTESMTNAPYLLDRARMGYRLGDGVLIDSILHDGLTDVFSGDHMGVCAEELAARFGLSRQEQDAFAHQSQQRYASASKNGTFTDELTAVDGLAADEHPRPDTTIEKLATLAPVFSKSGTITAGNASGVNDGAAMLVLCSLDTAQTHGWTPLAVLDAWASAGCEPRQFGLGPVHACRKLADDVNRFDLIEINEAFAAQTLACSRELAIDPSKLNVDGGAIALGHPIGASGARLLVHLAHAIARGRAGKAIASLCVGGGMGVACTLSEPKLS